MRSKIIHYYRCSISDNSIKFDLESAIKSAWVNLPNTKERTIYLPDKYLLGMQLKNKKNCTLISIGSYERKTPTNIIDLPSATDLESSSTELPPPYKKEFLDGESFICFYKNHVLVSTSNTLRFSKIENYIRKLLLKSNQIDDNTNNLLELNEIASYNSVKQIIDEGIKCIELNAYEYIASVKQCKRKSAKEISPIGELLKILNPKTDDAQIYKEAGMSTKIVINQNGSIKNKHSKSHQKELKNLANKITNQSNNGYVIETKKGTRITANQITVKETVKVKKHGKSVSPTEMFDQLEYILNLYIEKHIIK